VKSRALVLNAMVENLDALKCGGWGGCLSMGAPDSPVRHRTLSGAPATSPNRYGSTVGALTTWPTGQSGGAPDSHYSLSGAPSGTALTLRALTAHCSVHCSLLQTTVGAVAVAPHGTPNSPVLHRIVR
jgi:hypothetical protein